MTNYWLSGMNESPISPAWIFFRYVSDGFVGPELPLNGVSFPDAMDTIRARSPNNTYDASASPNRQDMRSQFHAAQPYHLKIARGRTHPHKRVGHRRPGPKEVRKAGRPVEPVVITRGSRSSRR